MIKQVYARYWFLLRFSLSNFDYGHDTDCGLQYAAARDALFYLAIDFILPKRKYIIFCLHRQS